MEPYEHLGVLSEDEEIIREDLWSEMSMLLANGSKPGEWGAKTYPLHVPGRSQR